MSSAGVNLRSCLTITAGLLIASGACAAVFALMSGDIRVFTPAFAIIAVVALCLGLPIYLAARASRNDTPRVAAVIGFAVGAAIPAILVLASAPDQASIAGTATVIDGRYTLAGWIQNITLIGQFGLLGFGGALTFWFIVQRLGPGGDESQKPRSPWPLRATLLSFAAAGVVAAAFVIPEVTADRSCHNPLRDGGDSIAQTASFDLLVGVDQWQAVAVEVERFQRADDWSVRSDVRIDGDFPWLQISLCKETGTNIFVQGMADLGEVKFGIYRPQHGEQWRQEFRTLYERISVRWPNKVSFEDDQGRQTSLPEWATAEEPK